MARKFAALSASTKDSCGEGRDEISIVHLNLVRLIVDESAL